MGQEKIQNTTPPQAAQFRMAQQDEESLSSEIYPLASYRRNGWMTGAV